MSLKFGIIGRQGSPRIQDSLQSICEILRKKEVDFCVEDETAKLMASRDVVHSPREMLASCSHLIVVGGDGSILGVARDFAHTNIPIVGVNRGGLGFLADVSPADLETGVTNVLEGRFRQEKHFLLTLTVTREGKQISSETALNDVVVNSGSLSKMMDFELFIDEEFVYSQFSDGLIVCSPTGSTAYSLSAGGPIMHPDLDALAVVPMFPHTLTARPLVVEGSSKIKIIPGKVAEEPQVSADSQVQIDLQPHDEVLISKYEHSIELIHPTTHSFYEACRSKLDWASRLGGALDNE